MATPAQPELRGLRIDREKKKSKEPSKWAPRWIVGGIALFLLLGAARLLYGWYNSATEVKIVRLHAVAAGGGGADSGPVILNATGYIIAAHKIELASKVVGKVLWIGVEKGERVRQGQTLVRLEDDEYRAQETQANGNLLSLQARLAELKNGSRPEEIQRASADLESARADLLNAKVTLDRTRQLVKDGVLARQALDDAQARYDGQTARVSSVERTYQLAKLGPRQEQMDAVAGQIEQARGQLALAQTQLSNTVIKAPVSGTILARNVEKGEFVTTGFVGDKGAKGYVVSIADLNDLQVELDINQNDFGKLGPQQRGVITTDAYPDRKYDGYVYEVSPEANRQKATVQVKVKIEKPDGYLRPEMNASVAFISEPKPGAAASSRPVLYVPAAAIRDGAVFVAADGRAVKRTVKTGGTNSQGVRIDDGLIGGEDVIVNAPADLKEGAKVRSKEKS